LRAKQAAVHICKQTAANCHFNDGCARKYFVRLLIFQARKESEKLAEPEGILHSVHTNQQHMHSPMLNRAAQCREQARLWRVSTQYTLKVTGIGISRVSKHNKWNGVSNQAVHLVEPASMSLQTLSAPKTMVVKPFIHRALLVQV
jgi:hypothetical protein